MRPHYPRFSESEYARRYGLIRGEMETRELDCLVIYGNGSMRDHCQVNVRWVSNYSDFVYFSYLVFPREGEPTLFVTIPHHIPSARQISPIEDVRAGAADPGGALARCIRERIPSVRRVGIVGINAVFAREIPRDHFAAMEVGLPAASFENATEWFEALRSVKSEEEMAYMERGAELTDIAYRAMVAAIRPGATDTEVYNATWRAVLDAGGKYFFQLFGSTPMSDPMMVYPWTFPSNRPIQRGDLVITEISASYEGYCGQIIRTLAVGQEPPEESLRLYDLTLRVYEAIHAELRPGRSDADVYHAAQPLLDAGYRCQVLVHGWSQNLERPYIGYLGLQGQRADAELSAGEFRENMTLMIEPNPYTEPGKLGVFLGDLCVVTPEGGRRLQKVPLDFQIL